MTARLSAVFALSVLLLCSALSDSGLAEPLSTTDRKCVQTLGTAGFKVAKAQTKLGAMCIRDEALAKIGDADTCIAADEKGKVAKATGKTLDLETKKCLTPPPFGYAGGTPANAIAVEAAMDLLRDAVDVADDLVVIDKEADKDGATCQKKLLKTLDNVFLKTLQEFNKCAKKGLRTVVGADEFRDTCFDSVELSRIDPKGKIRKTADKLAKVREKTCDGVDLSTVVPGRCGGESGSALDACLEVRAACQACRVLAGTYELAENCDLFDDGLINASCGVPDGTFALSIGDTVSDGVPTAGAGNIEVPAAHDVYAFFALAGQVIFFDEHGVSGVLFLPFDIIDPTGATVVGGSLGGADLGLVTLPLSGTYLIDVGDDLSGDSGTYSFTIWDVPDDDEFAIAIGDVVSDGVPGLGAGNIEAPGARDVYTFAGTAGQKIFFDEQGANGTVLLDYVVTDPNGGVVISQGLSGGEPGLVDLPLTGTYTVTVGDDDDDAMGTYGFQIWDVPADDMFAISIGDAVADGVPGVGAGNIEAPGARDVYTFAGTAGQMIFFDEQGQNGTLLLDYELRDPSNGLLISHGLGGADSGLVVLPATGTYTVTVGDDLDDSVGTYTFQIWDVPAADMFAISIGDAVSDGVPGVGAGNIEVPGARDVYTFTGTAGQTITFDEQGQSGTLLLDYVITDPGANVILSNSLGGGQPGPIVLPSTGTYTITVGDDTDDSMGTYAFQIVF